MEERPVKNQHPEIITVAADARQVACNGGDGALGHPVVYYTFDGGDEIVCGYCDRAYIRAGQKTGTQ